MHKLVDEVADVLAFARELDSGSVGSGIKDLRALRDQARDLRGLDLRDDQLATVHQLAGHVLDLDHLDQALELLAHLVGLCVARVDRHRHPRPTGMAARADGDGADVEAALADEPGDLAQRVGAILYEHGQHPYSFFPAGRGGRRWCRLRWGFDHWSGASQKSFGLLPG